MKKILLVFGALLAGFLAYVATRSPDFMIQRETVIQAKADKIFPYINNSKMANEWMPWKESDPKVVMNYSGPDEGVGSKSSWTSEGQMGTGEAVVVASVPNQKVVTQLTYTKPMNMAQTAEITLNPAGESTKVQWSVRGRNSFLGRMMCVFFNMDEMVGGEFEKGLAKLKTIVEKNQ